jgi:hypothetical protein
VRGLSNREIPGIEPALAIPNAVFSSINFKRIFVSFPI